MIEKVNKDSFYLEELEKNFPQVFTKNDILGHMKNNTFTHYFTYLVDSKPIAFINYDLIYDRVELIDINVLEEFQNQHIASKLMEYMIEEAKQNHAVNITLEVNMRNFKAIHLYEKYGFHKVAIRKGYYQGIDAILMEKELM